MAPVQPGLANRTGAFLDRTEFGKKASDFLALEPTVTPGGYAVCLYPSTDAPPPQSVRMDMEEPGHFPDRKQFIHMFPISHIYSGLLFHLLILRLTHFN